MMRSSSAGFHRRGEQGRVVMEALLLPFLAILILLIIWLLSSSNGSGLLAFANRAEPATATPIVSATMPATWTATNTLPPQSSTPQPTRPTPTSLIPIIPTRFPIATETAAPLPQGPPTTPTATKTPNYAATASKIADYYYGTLTAIWVTETAFWEGQGTATISPSTVAVNSTGNEIVIEYRPGSISFSAGWIALVIPSGWSPLSSDLSQPGFTEVTASSGATNVQMYYSGDEFYVYMDSLNASTGMIQITYGSKSGGGPGATAPSSPQTSYFDIFTDPLGEGWLWSIANEPSVQVVATTATPTRTPTPSNTPTPSYTPTSTPSYTPTPSDTLTPTASDTPTPSDTPTATFTDTPTSTNTPTATYTPTPSDTPTPTATNTPTATYTYTPTPTTIPGQGSMDLTPASVTVGSTGNELIFDFYPDTSDFVNGQIQIVIPAGWSPPSDTPTDPGFMIVSAFGGASGISWSIAGNTFIIDVTSMDASSGTIRVRYGNSTLGGPGATAPSSPETSVFLVYSDPIGTDGIAVAPIPVQPTVDVTP